MTSSPSLILVDDDRTNSELLQMLLEMDGFAVRLCPTIPQAVQAVSAATDCCLVDINLAGDANGLDLIRAIRAGETNGRVDMIAVATSGDDHWQSQALAAGATDFLLKPFSPSELSSYLLSLLEAN